MYRIGFPLWRVAAKMGLPLKLLVYVYHDTEENVFVATSKDLPGLVVEADSMDQLVLEINFCVEDLLLQELHAPVLHRPTTDLRLGTV